MEMEDTAERNMFVRLSREADWYGSFYDKKRFLQILRYHAAEFSGLHDVSRLTNYEGCVRCYNAMKKFYLVICVEQAKERDSISDPSKPGWKPYYYGDEGFSKFLVSLSNSGNDYLNTHL